MKIITKIIAMTKAALKGTPEGDHLEESLRGALALTEKKRYYVSDYGFANAFDVVAGKTTELIPNPQNIHKFELPSIIEWWKKKATHRHKNLIGDGRLRTIQETWNNDMEIDIIR